MKTKWVCNICNPRFGIDRECIAITDDIDGQPLECLYKLADYAPPNWHPVEEVIHK